MNNNLTKEQLKAVVHDKGPALCIAVPGSGKTHLLSHRMKALIEHGVDPKRILLCTFSVKSAGELSQRIKDLGINPKLASAKTLHSICFRIMKSEWPSVKSIKHFKADDFQIARPHFFTSMLEEEKTKFNPYAYYVAWERWKDFGRAAALEDPNYSSTWKFWELKQREAVVATPATFGDLLNWTFDLFRSNEAVAEKWGEMWDYILLDEAQDTSRIQWAILRTFNSTNNFMAVGDDNQSIYSFRAADIRSFLEFSQGKKCKVYPLSKNFRSHAKITSLADELMKGHTISPKKKMVPYKEDGPSVRFIRPKDQEQEAYIISKLIDPKNLGKTAILARTNSVLEPFERALMRAGYAFQRVGGGTSFYRLPWIEPIIRILIKYQEGSLSKRRAEALAPLAQTPSSLIVGILDGPIGLRKKFKDREEDSTPDEDWMALLQVAVRYKTLTDYLKIIRPLTDHQDIESSDSITLSTTHRAKGLEWDTVFCAGISEGIIPHNKSNDEEEERRILYVMVSRASERLIITCPETYYGQTREPSRFIDDLDPEFDSKIIDEIYHL